MHLFKIGASSDLAITSRIADSETACIVSRGCAKLNKNFAGSAIFHTTEKSISTMFSSPVSIKPSSWLDDLLPTPISSVFSLVTVNTSCVMNGHGAKFSPDSPVL